MKKKTKRRKFYHHQGLRCLLCEDIIVSTFRHDFKSCRCGNCFVDGGFDYFRCGYKDLKDVEQLDFIMQTPPKEKAC